jgi:polyisoprenoid-binding protein YceI
MTTVETWLADPDSVGAWTAAPDRSTVAFRNRSFWGLAPVKGRFREFSGDARLTAAGSVSGRLDIRAASLHTGIGQRDAHLRSADFFDVERFPIIGVEVTALRPGRGNSAELDVTLTVKETAKSLLLPATVTIGPDGAVTVSARTTIDRKQFGVTGNLLGMVTSTTTLLADVVFVKSA